MPNSFEAPLYPPLCTELPYLLDGQDASPLRFAALRKLPYATLLDSTQAPSDDARYDIAVANPILTLTTRGDITMLHERSGKKTESTGDPFSLLQEALGDYPKQTPTTLPFCGGALGYFAYDLGRRLEDLPSIALDAENIPDMIVGIYDWALITDHQQQRCWLASYGLHSDTAEQWPSLVKQLHSPKPEPAADFHITSPLQCNFDRAHYQIAFDKIQDYIREGDCYQVNLAKRFETKAEGDPWLAYQLLRQQNSAPFSAYCSFPDITLLSASPERLLQVSDKHIETKPIKGTRPRDLSDPIRDKALADELQASLKDRAENLMIVDLLRNDLGKVCQPGSIRVPDPFALESFATVHHLVSTITGTLADNHDAVSLLRACFPGGSITGAPKLRAMEIIEELEPNRRGLYCGSIGYIGFDGNMDSNITIRTLVYSDNRLRFYAGGGIVADSDADAEFQEIDDKAAALLAIIAQLSE